MNKVKDHRLYLILCAVLYLGFTLPLIPEAADDIRMADVFSVDESGAAAVMRHLYRMGSLELRTFSYGGLFYYLPLLLLRLWDIVGGVSDRVIILTMRGVCTAAGLGCLWLTWRIGCAVFGRVAGLMGVFLLLATPTFLRWSVETHPDLPQLFWMLLALLYCCRLCRAFSLKDVALASVFAGLAAGTKYAGAFLLPLIAMATLLPVDGGRLSVRASFRRIRDRRYLLALVLIPAVFFLVFALTNPYALIHFKTFKADVEFEKAHLSFGHMFRAEQAGFRWLISLGHLVGAINGAILAAYVLFLIAGRVLGKIRLPADRIVLLVWIGGFTGYLMLTANIQAPRHLLPVLPLALLFVGSAYCEIWQWTLKRSGGRPAAHLALPLLLVCLSWGRLAEEVDLFQHKWGRDERSDEIVAGRWVGAHFSAETSILFDAYAYVPDKFGRVYRTFGQSYPVVNHFQPDLLVIRAPIAGRYSRIEDAKRGQMGKTVFLDRHYFYRYLKEGRIPTYRLLKDFGKPVKVAVYKRVGSEKKDRPGKWLDRVKPFAAGKLYGLADSRQKMGEIHASLGAWNEAIREYRLLSEMAPNFALAHYKLACMYLGAGRLEEANGAFDRAFALIASKPPDYRATIRHNMARQYFETGFYARAIVQLREALRLNPALREAYYDLGTFYLAQGDYGRADSAYAEAVRRYGADPQTAERLREMVRKGVGGDEAARILTAYFGGGTPNE